MSLEHPSPDDPHVTIQCQQDPDASVQLHSRYFPSEYGVGFAVQVSAAGRCRGDELRAVLHEVEVWGYDTVWLPDFFGALSADFRGWSGARAWSTNHLAVSAAFHSGGRVELTWDLESWVSRDSWRTSITTWLDAGEQMSSLAADLREFLPWPRTGTALPGPVG